MYDDVEYGDAKTLSTKLAVKCSYSRVIKFLLLCNFRLSNKHEINTHNTRMIHAQSTKRNPHSCLAAWGSTGKCIATHSDQMDACIHIIIMIS